MQVRKQFRNSIDNRDPRYKLKAWKNYRLVILKRDGWSCQMCGVALVTGRTSRLAAVVDHIIPAWLRPDLFFCEENTRAVCKKCHDGPCQAIEARHGDDADALKAAKLAWHPGGYDADGFPLDPSHPWSQG